MEELYKRGFHTGLALLRIFACIGVVCLHSFGAIGKIDSKLSYIIWYGCTFSIPIFFALSGYLTLGRSLTYKQALKKIIGIVLLMLAWFILIAVYKMIVTKSFYNPICDFVLSFFQKGSLPRYWYFWDLMILIFITPFIERVFNTEKRKWIFFTTLTGMCLVSNAINIHSIIRGGYSIYSYDAYPLFRQTYKIWIFMTYYYMGGMIRGNRISEKIRNSRSRIAISIGNIISIVITIAYEYVVIGAYMITNSTEYHHDSPFVIFSVFLILLFFGVLHERYTDNVVLMVLSLGTLGVYVLHGHIESFLRRVIIAENFLDLLLLMLVTVILSFCFSIIMGRIPVIRVLVSTKTNLKILN